MISVIFLLFFTPKLSTTREIVIKLVMCRHNPGVWGTSRYKYGDRFTIRPFFAIAPDFGRP